MVTAIERKYHRPRGRNKASTDHIHIYAGHAFIGRRSKNSDSKSRRMSAWLVGSLMSGCVPTTAMAPMRRLTVSV